MNIKATFGLTGALIAAGTLAACGGGSPSGTSATNLSPAAVTAPASGGGTTSTVTAHGSTTTFTFIINRAPRSKPTVKSTARSTALAARTAAAKRTPQYISDNAQGMQITVTSGSATQTLYYGISLQSPECAEDATTQIETCALTAPTLGTTESLNAIETDAAPTNESTTTGLGTAFPSNAHVLAIGTQTLALIAGAINAIPFSVNPVIDGLRDDGCGSSVYDNNINVDRDNDPTVFTGPRIVVTPNTAGSTFANPTAFDAAADAIYPPSCTNASPYTCTGQSFVDVNASPVPLTVTSSSSIVTVYPVPLAQLPNYYQNGGTGMTPPAPFTQTATIPDSSYLYYYGCCGTQLDVSMSGAAIPTGTTVTLSNGLTATPPVFTGPPASGLTAQPGPYTASLTYTIVTITASPATLTFASATDTPQVVTGSDVGAGTYGGLYPAPVPANNSTYSPANTTCVSGSTTIANIAGGTFTGGSQPFTVTPAAVGTCAFVLYDEDSGVVTNTINVTVN